MIQEARAGHLHETHLRFRAIKALYLIGIGEVSAGTMQMNDLTHEMEQLVSLKDYERLLLKNYIALGLHDLDQNDKAIKLLEEVDRLAVQMNLRSIRMPILHNLGRAWLRSDDGENAGLRAKPYIEAHLGLAREFQMEWDEAMALVSLALIDKRSRQWESAVQKAQDAVKIFVAVDDALRLSEAQNILAQVEIERKNWDAALRYTEEAMKHTSKSDHKRRIQQLHHNLYQIHKGKGNTREALAHLEQYTELNKTLTAEREKNEFRKITVSMGLALEEERNRNQAKELASQKRINSWQTLAMLLLTLSVLGTILAFLRIRKIHQKIAALNAFIRNQVLSRFLPPELVQEISEGRSRFNEAAERVEVTVLFADLCSFTRATEALGVENISMVLNQFLSSMTDVIFRHGGTIDKFIGDGIMVIFGAPTPMSTVAQAQRASACAAAMMEELDRLNQSWRIDFQWEFQMRIGLHQGPSIVGSFGGERRQDYTVVGSAVNIASRIEADAEPNQILLTMAVAQHLRPEQVRAAGARQLRGVSMDVDVYALILEGEEQQASRAS